MVDGFQGYDKLKNVKRCACYAHIRRYFLDAVTQGGEKELSNPAVQSVAYCDKLFRYERRYKEQGHPYEQQQKRRLKEEKPVVGPFIKYILEQRPIYKTSDADIEKIAPWSDNFQKTCR